MACSCHAYSVSRWSGHSRTRCHKKRQQTITLNPRVRCWRVLEGDVFFAPKQQEALKEI